MKNPDQIRSAHFQRFQSEPTLFSAPGRVNLIGEHTDYAEGFVMPAAINFTTIAAISPRNDGQIVIYAENFSEEMKWDLAALPAKRTHHWSDYPLGVISILQGEGFTIPAFSLTLSGDVPLGSGLSSSASVEVATMTAILSFLPHSYTMPQVARLCQRAENEFVGAQTGIMDQFISSCGRENHVLLLDCRDLSFRLAPLPEHIAIVIANTMIRHSNVGGDYNTRRAEVEEATQVLQRHRKEIRKLRDATVGDLERWGAEMPVNVLKRARHVLTDSARAVAASDALFRNDLKELGRLMAEAHVSYRDDFEASCPEADLMVELANVQPGLIGARLTGGGWGGCTVNLVEKSFAPAFSEALHEGYHHRTSIAPDVYICQASAGAQQLEIPVR
jgi:galactokinase